MEKGAHTHINVYHHRGEFRWGVFAPDDRSLPTQQKRCQFSHGEICERFQDNGNACVGGKEEFLRCFEYIRSRFGNILLHLNGAPIDHDSIDLSEYLELRGIMDILTYANDNDVVDIESLQSVFSRVAAKYHLQGEFEAARVCYIYKGVVRHCCGEKLAEMTSARYFKDGILYVSAKNSSAAQRLQIGLHKVLKELQETLGTDKIQGIRIGQD